MDPSCCYGQPVISLEGWGAGDPFLECNPNICDDWNKVVSPSLVSYHFDDPAHEWNYAINYHNFVCVSDGVSYSGILRLEMFYRCVPEYTGSSDVAINLYILHDGEKTFLCSYESQFNKTEDGCEWQIEAGTEVGGWACNPSGTYVVVSFE